MFTCGGTGKHPQGLGFPTDAFSSPCLGLRSLNSKEELVGGWEGGNVHLFPLQTSGRGVKDTEQMPVAF